jgi:glutamate N-acetyltransferase/amino-acid N-acetyltransferase
VLNAGNANACTGEQGEKDALAMATLAAERLGLKPEDVLVFSTGIIGRPMPMEKIEAGIERAAGFVRSQKNTGDFARGIMTTDLVPKTAAVTFKLGDATVHISGACKGSGMIAPNMATMLGVVATDAAIAPNVLAAALEAAAEDTFNCVTVDGDTSTNDSLAVFASGLAGNAPISRTNGVEYEAFYAGLHAVCDSLARQIAADGEGAQHTITVYVGGTKDNADARKIARTISESPLVKTAIAGEDANRGRVVMAVGKAGEPANRDKLSISFNGIRVATRGARDPSYDEAEVSALMKQPKIQIKVGLGLGKGRDRVLTCDLTKEYVAINGDYRS